MQNLDLSQAIFVYINQYYQKYKEKLLTKAHERYQNLSEEEKDKRRKRSEIDVNICPKKKGKNYLSI